MITVWIEYPEAYAARVTSLFKRELEDVVRRHIDVSHTDGEIYIQTSKCTRVAPNTGTYIDIISSVNILPQASDALIKDVKAIAGEHVFVKVYVHIHGR